MVMPIGTSTSPVFLILPTRLNIFVPAFLLGSDLGEILGARANDDRDVGPGLDIVDYGGFPVDPFLNGKGGRWRGSPIFPSIGSNQSGLLATDERPGPSDQL